MLDVSKFLIGAVTPRYDGPESYGNPPKTDKKYGFLQVISFFFLMSAIMEIHPQRVKFISPSHPLLRGSTVLGNLRKISLPRNNSK